MARVHFGYIDVCGGAQSSMHTVGFRETGTAHHSGGEKEESVRAGIHFQLSFKLFSFVIRRAEIHLQLIVN